MQEVRRVGYAWLPRHLRKRAQRLLAGPGHELDRLRRVGERPRIGHLSLALPTTRCRSLTILRLIAPMQHETP